MFIGHRKGFTMTEMMVTIAVIAILAAMVIPNLVRSIKISRFTKAKHFVKDVVDSAEIYQAVTGNFPTSITSLTETTPPFLDPVVADKYCNPDISLTKFIDGYGHACMFNMTAGSDDFAYYIFADETDGSGFFLTGLYSGGSNSGRYLINETSP